MTKSSSGNSVMKKQVANILIPYTRRIFSSGKYGNVNTRAQQTKVISWMDNDACYTPNPRVNVILNDALHKGKT